MLEPCAWWRGGGKNYYVEGDKRIGVVPFGTTPAAATSFLFVPTEEVLVAFLIFSGVGGMSGTRCF